MSHFTLSIWAREELFALVVFNFDSVWKVFSAISLTLSVNFSVAFSPSPNHNVRNTICWTVWSSRRRSFDNITSSDENILIFWLVSWITFLSIYPSLRGLLSLLPSSKQILALIKIYTKLEPLTDNTVPDTNMLCRLRTFYTLGVFFMFGVGIQWLLQRNEIKTSKNYVYMGTTECDVEFLNWNHCLIRIIE